MRNRDKYHEEWEDRIRPAVLKRDKYQCKRCGVRHRKSYVFDKNGGYFEIPESEIKEWKGYGEKAYKVWLQVAHLDHDKSNNEMENLECMCVKCHLNYDRENKWLMRKSKLRNAGFKQ